MSWITARRRRRAAGYAVVLLGLVMAGTTYAAVTAQASPASAASPPPNARQIALGRQLFSVTCASCHGMNAQGVSGQGPSLIGVGAAAVYFQVSTGRMPGKETAAEMPR
ncbi:MAG: cytochrome c, partial [Actinobacteria bacterium]|nr:cytochrome c [Actinomycetota bacterium]